MVPGVPLPVYAGGMSRASLEVKRRLLARVPLFAGLAPEALDSLVQVTRGQTLRPKEELFHKGDEGTEFYVIVRGALKALTTSEGGDDVVFSILGDGDVFGEVALLGASRRSATVTAIESTELLVVERRDFLGFLGDHPPAAIELLRVLAERLRRVSELFEDTLFLNLPVRLAKMIARQARAYGEKTPEGTRITLKLSQEEWGDLVGATRESINKQLRAWTGAGLVTLDHGHILVHDLEALDKLAGTILV